MRHTHRAEMTTHFAIVVILALLLIAALASATRAEAAATFEDRVMEIVNQERWANGQLLPPGNYFISVRAGSERGTVKVVLAR